MKEQEYLKYSDCVKDRSLLLRYIGPSLWEYKANMKYWLSFYHKNEYIILHKGDTTDLASTPCFGQCIIPKEKYMISCIHDEGYSPRTSYIYIEDKNNLSIKFKELQEHGKWVDDKTFLPNKKFWDLLFLSGMREELLVFYGQTSIKPYLGYLAVRIGGNKRYKFKG